jgi:hypothetical protein
MAAAFRFWGKLGYGDGVAGHITVRDPILHDHYWFVSRGLTVKIDFNQRII